MNIKRIKEILGFSQSISPVGVAIVAAFATSNANGDIIGIDRFEYSNGSIADSSGGIGFDWNQSTKSNTGTSSDWDIAYGAPTVAGGKLNTSGGGSQICDREYNGPIEAVSFSYEDDQQSAGAIRANFQEDQDAVIYYKIEMTRSELTAWSGISTLDFDTETIFFGVPTTSAPSGNREFGIEVRESDPSSQVGRTFSGVVPEAGRTYCLVAKIDYGNDLLSLWLDPDLDSNEGLSSPLVTRPHTGVNWSTGIRITAGNEASWDNLIVATTWDELKTVLPKTPPPNNSALKAKIKRQLKGLSKQLKKAKRAKKKSKAKKVSKKIRILKRRFRSL